MSSVLEDDPLWFQRAVFYEVLVRGFYDANNDGTGDIKGLTEKLDYLEWLGVDCIWLLPFYQSPLRDDGYDISDFFTILPEYGEVDDIEELMDEAHRRGIRINRTPIELRGRVPFPPIGDLNYFVTLGPYGTYWFQLLDHHER